MFLTRFLTAVLVSGFIFSACGPGSNDLEIKYEKYTLENGLEVILHEDRSDPIVSVAIIYHVGSNREVKGRTGFAHLFEHMMFQESQHVGQDQFFKKIQGAGGTLNGGTWQDGTVYYQVVPKNALEMVLWLESDRMGYLLSTVTQEAFMNQQDVVQNEKRQRYDNQPYGHTGYVIGKLLYPENHPYNWQTIGSLEDLRNASLSDIHNFYKKWYGPNNATLVIAGDYEKETTKEWVEKYFGEIKSSETIEELKPQHVDLEETKKAYHEDNFAQSPELNMVYPTVEQFSEDSYALEMFATLFSDGKKAPLYKVIVEEKKLAPEVSAYQNSQEITGEFRLRIRAFPGTDLDSVEAAVKEAIERFDKEGFTEEDLERIKIRREMGFYNGISSILGKSFQLALYNEFAGSPDFITTDLNNYLEVTKEDINNVFNKYIKNENYVLTSFVPKGNTQLIADGSEKFPVVEEEINEQDQVALNEGENVQKSEIEVEEIATSFDRTEQPPFGEDPLLKIPEIWTSKLSNEIEIYGIEHNELPLVEFSVTMRGGMLFDDPDNVGVANLMSDIMMEGTKNKTPLELEEAIDDLGASINMYTTKESVVLTARCLTSKFNDTYELVEEIMFEPRWDEKEFSRIKDETVEAIKRNQANPAIVANQAFDKLIYGEDNILSNSTYGTVETVNSIKIDDLKEYYKNYFAPNLTYIAVVGDISKEDAVGTFKSLELRWEKKDVQLPDVPQPELPQTASLYFIDFPDAKQSEIRIGSTGPSYTDENFYKANVMNYKLGGSFNGIVNMILREEKGYTYGARTRFTGTEHPGYFVASSSVQSNATYESAQIFQDELNKYRKGISKDDLEFTKNALVKSNSLRFETLGALRNMLENIARYDLPLDYVKQREEEALEMTLDEHRSLAEKYIEPNRMYYLIVGDAETQLDNLKQLGVGNPILLDKDGNRLN